MGPKFPFPMQTVPYSHINDKTKRHEAQHHIRQKPKTTKPHKFAHTNGAFKQTQLYINVYKSLCKFYIRRRSYIARMTILITYI